MATQKSPPRDVCLSHCVQNDTGQWVDVEKRDRKKSLFLLFFFSLFILCLFALFVLGFFIQHLLVPCWDFFFFWLSYKALMKAFQANMLIFVSMGMQKAWQCHRGFGQQTGGKHCCFFHAFIHIVSFFFSISVAFSFLLFSTSLFTHIFLKFLFCL